MAFNFQDQLNRGREIIVEAGPPKVLVGGILLAASLALIMFIMFFRGGASYELLYSQLEAAEAGAIVNELKTQKVPYKLTQNGTAIEVPADQVAAARLDLAVKGLPAKGNVGYEIFDTQKLGATDLVQKTNLLRAVSGELERTITSMPEIEMARVHLSVPKETLFIEEQKDPTASVVVKLRRGADLDKQQLLGIVNLVTASVAGLKPDNVSVVDTEGGLIWSKDLNKPGILNDDQLKQKARYEESVKRRIQAMLEGLVGHGKAITTVNADLDLKEVVTNEDIYDPERSAVRSETRMIEKGPASDRSNAGVPNATFELGTANRQNSNAGDGQTQYSKTDEVTNYEVTNIKRQIVSRAGDIKKISVSVIMDGIYTTNEAGETIFAPRSPEFIAQMEQAVKAVIGFDETRGDIVSITSAQFAPTEEVSVWALFALDLIREFSRPIINIILILLVFFLIVRPVVNWLKKEVEPVGSGAEAPVLPEYPAGSPSYADTLPIGRGADGQEDLPDGQGRPGLPEKTFDQIGAVTTPNYDEEEEIAENAGPAALTYGNLSRENILPLARENLDRTVGLVRDWIEDKPAESAKMM